MKLKPRLKGVESVGRGRLAPGAPPPPKGCERLVAVAIMRGDETHHGFKSHRELRQSLGDENPDKRQRGDFEGFWTSEDRFVSREQAVEIGKISGQVSKGFYGRDLLSSDINW